MATRIYLVFSLFQREFRKSRPIAFAVIMVLALAHLFGLYNPKQLADSPGVPHQAFSTPLKDWSLYHLKTMLLRFMVKHAAEHLGPVLAQSAATRSRAGLSLSIDNSVIDRLSKCLRCTWSWYSGRCKKVVHGPDLLGIVLTLHPVALPLHRLFCSKQGRANTDKPSQLLTMLARLNEEFGRYAIDITQIPLTLDSWFVSEPLRQQRYALGFTTIILAGKGHDTCTINHGKQQASAWKKTVHFSPPTWGIDVPSCRVRASNPTFGSVVLFFFQQSTTRRYDLMTLSRQALRGAEIGYIWKHHHAIECFWKVLKSVWPIRDMRLHGPGLYTGLLIKVLAYLLAIRLRAHRAFSTCSITQIMRTLRRDYDLRDVLAEHFHGPCSTT